MKYRSWIYLTVLIGAGLISCTSLPPIPGTDGQGSARITKFTITKADNAFIKEFSIACDIQEGADSGIIHGILPAGTKPFINVRWTTKKGVLWVDGIRLSSKKPLDSSSVSQIVAVDAQGKTRLYRLDIREAAIPTIYIETENSAPILTKTDWVKGKVSIVGGSTSWSKPLKASGMKVRGRGNSTWGMAKKPYRFTLDEAAPVLGLPKAKKWVLLANYSDKSLLRNFVAFSVASTLDGLEYPVHQYPVNLYLNGEYEGIYGLGEQVETGAGRVSIEKPDDSPETSFFIEVNMRIDSETEKGVLGKDFFMSPSGLKLEYKTPDTDVVSDIQRKNIAAFIAEAEKAILAGEGYERYIDVDSFIDWLIMEELFKNQDSIFLSSVYLNRQKGGKLTLGPVWDFDLAAGNSDYGAIGQQPTKDPEGWFPLYSEWFSGLYRDRVFRQAVALRWSTLRAKLEQKTFEAIEEYTALLSEVQEDNFRRWPIMGVYVWPNPPELVAAATYEAQVEALAAWFRARFLWMDGAMRILADM